MVQNLTSSLHKHLHRHETNSSLSSTEISANRIGIQIKEQNLVACNVYISAGRENQKESLVDLLSQTQERCRLLRNGLLPPTENAATAPITSNGATISINEMSPSREMTKPKVMIVHAYADGPYDRSSFHLAGDADSIADAASFLAVSALELFSIDSVSDEDCSGSALFHSSTQHPSVGIVDHVSVMPLHINPALEGNFVSVTESSEVECIPPDAHGRVAQHIGKCLAEKGVKIFYYGSANPNGTPLATVRREQTSFFKSGFIDQDDETTGAINQHTATMNHKRLGVCTVGSPPSFVENFNIRLTPRCSKQVAMTLTKRLRERDGGAIPGLEALTLLYYSDGKLGGQRQYEVACNLLRPKAGSVEQILVELDEWVEDQIAKGDSKCGDRHLSTNSSRRKYFVEEAYRVGTNAEQCIDVLKKENYNDEIFHHDTRVLKQFSSYFFQDKSEH